MFLRFEKIILRKYSGKTISQIEQKFSIWLRCRSEQKQTKQIKYLRKF